MAEKRETSRDDQSERDEPKAKRLELSVPQVAGSAVAAVVAAKLASGLGVYGTILGAGVVSALATCGGTVFQHFFRRTGEQLREAKVPKTKARKVPVTSAGRPVPRTFRSDASMEATQGPAPRAREAADCSAPVPSRRGTAALPTTITWGAPAAQATPGAAPTSDVEAATALPRVSVDTVRPAESGLISTDSTGFGRSGDSLGGPDDKTQFLDTGGVADLLPDDTDGTRLLSAVGGGDPDRTQVLRAKTIDEATRVLRSADVSSAPALPEGEPGDEFTPGIVHRSRVKSWKRPLIAAALVFGVTMGGITTYELVSGQSFSGDTKSTTIGDAFKGDGATQQDGGDTTPSPSTSGQPSDDTGSPADGATQQDGGDPATDENATPTPTPSDGTGSGTGSDTGSDTAPDTDSGSDSGADSGSDDGSSDSGDSDTTPTPTPTTSADTGDAAVQDAPAG